MRKNICKNVNKYKLRMLIACQKLPHLAKQSTDATKAA